MPNENTYQSVLYKLSKIPVEALTQIDAYLKNFAENGTKARNREAILSFAGSWGDMSEDDFEEYLFEAKRSGYELFGRDAKL